MRGHPTMHALLQHTVLPEPEIREKIAAAQAGDSQARDDIITHNMQLVMHTARKMDDDRMEDLLGVGVFGLVEAINRFDLTKFESKFSTYAVWWIRMTMQRCRQTDTLIRIPYNLARRFYKWYAQKDDQIPPTQEELVEYGFTSGEARRILKLFACRLGEYDDHKGLKRPGSSPLEVAAAKDQQEQVERVLEQMPERIRTILVRRFGLDGQPIQSLETLGERFGVSRERVRQLQNEGLEILRRGVSE